MQAGIADMGLGVLYAFTQTPVAPICISYLGATPCILGLLV